MSEMQIESQVAPDPAATSIGNDQAANATDKPELTSDVSAAPTTSEDAVMAEEKTAEATEKAATGDASATKEDDNTTRQSDYPNKKRKSNNKSDFSELPESSDASEIRRQVEFYFSDSNLPTDKYLLEQTGGHLNKPVDLKVIHNFKRMRHFQPYTAVFDAVKASSMLNITDDGSITRKTPLSEKFTQDIEENRKIHQDKTLARSIYAKGFGEETKRSQTDIEEFFAVYGTVNAVRLRRKQDGYFKGSVFVEFATEQEVEDFLKLDPKPKFKAADGEEKELEIKSKKEYVDAKVEDIKEGRVAPNSPRRSTRNGGNDRRDRDQSRGGGRGGRGRGGQRGGQRGGNRGGSRGGNRGGRGGRDRDDRRGPSDRNDERANKRSAPDSGEQGEAKKAKTDA